VIDLAELHHELGIPPDFAAMRGWPLQPEPEPAELASIGTDIFGREQRLIRPAADAWAALRDAAAAETIVLQPVSAFRDVAYQADVIRRKRASGRALEEILRVNAVPGYSEHHTGRALDITTPGVEALDEAFETSEAFAWLVRNAERHGFHLSYPRDNPLRMAYEPWHWAWHG
jgi:D-alanyl-D-alanine carboxypeptidase